MTTRIVPAAPAAGNAGIALPRPHRWGGGHRDPVAFAIAPQLGMRPQAVEKLIHGPKALNHRVAVIVRAFRQLADDVRLARFWEPMQAAYDQREAPPLVAATWQIAQDADGREDSAEIAYQLDPSDANLERLIKAKELEIYRETALVDALRAEQRQRAACR